MLSIRVDDLTGDATRSLLALHLADMYANSPPNSVFSLDLRGLSVPEVTVWSAWKDDALAGIVALKELAESVGELKSMRVHPDFLRLGVGEALLEHVINQARGSSYRRLSLETGRGPAFKAAISLYEKWGFVEGDKFASYEKGKFSRFFHLDL